MSRVRNLGNRSKFEDYGKTDGTKVNDAWDVSTQTKNSPGSNQYEEHVDLPRKSVAKVPICSFCRRRDNLNKPSNICTHCIVRKKNPLIEKFMRMQLLSKYTHNFVQWSGICAAIFLALLMDILLRCPSLSYAWLHRIEVIICKGTFMGIFLCLGLYFFTMRCIRIHDITKEQKQLLGIFDDDDGNDDDVDIEFLNMKNNSLNNVTSSASDGVDGGVVSKLKYHFKGNHYYRPCMCLICKTLSSVRPQQQFRELLKLKWQPMLPPAARDASSFPLRTPQANSRSPYANLTVPQHNRTPISSTQLWQKNSSPDNLNRSNWSKNSSFRSAYASLHEDLISNERDLKNYLEKTCRKYDDIDTLNNMYVNSKPGNAWNPFVSFWRYFSKPANNFGSPVYQFSPLPVTTPVNVNHEQNTQDMYVRQSVLVKGISPDCLVQYVAKLRRWLSSTILERLCVEIKASNKIFRECGLTDVEIGNVGLERLRKIVEDREFVNRYMPDLPTLYRFLNFCANQSYYVQRIKELANGSCLADYNWNNITSQKLGNQLPSDAAILFHIFCVYIDSQLMPMPQGGSERPFYSQYVILDDGKRSVNDLMKCVRNRSQCAIICNDLLRPKFSFICNNEIQSCVSDCNNLFYVIIQFLLYMRNHKDGMLEGVSLGIQGINILCVIED